MLCDRYGEYDGKESDADRKEGRIGGEMEMMEEKGMVL